MVNSFKYSLIIDDNKALTFLNKMMLTKLDVFEFILTAENGEDALSIIAEHGIPELIFLDINMPIMNGWEFLETYNKIDPSMSESTIVLITGAPLDSQEEKIARVKYNITHFSNKIPVKEDVLNLISNTHYKTEQIEYFYK